MWLCRMSDYKVVMLHVRLQSGHVILQVWSNQAIKWLCHISDYKVAMLYHKMAKTGYKVAMSCHITKWPCCTTRWPKLALKWLCHMWDCKVAMSHVRPQSGHVVPQDRQVRPWNGYVTSAHPFSKRQHKSQLDLTCGWRRCHGDTPHPAGSAVCSAETRLHPGPQTWPGCWQWNHRAQTAWRCSPCCPQSLCPGTWSQPTTLMTMPR